MKLSHTPAGPETRRQWPYRLACDWAMKITSYLKLITYFTLILICMLLLIAMLVSGLLGLNSKNL